MKDKPYIVVVWGDSIAASGWPARAEFIHNAALNVGRPVKIINKGVCGMAAAEAKAHFEKDILANHPDLVIIQFGLNDARYAGSRGNQPFSTVEEFEGHISQMVEMCRTRSSSAVIVFGNHVTPTLVVMPDGLGYNETRIRYNKAAARAAGRQNVRYCDMGEVIGAAGLKPREVVTEDSVHLSPLGLETYAQIAANEIAAALRKSG